MVKKPYISIIIPAYNSEKTIGACLSSIYNSHFKNFEVIIVNDNSKDNTSKIAKKFPCKIIELKQNKGPANARNKGAEISRGEILLFLDSDTEMLSNTLDEIVKSFKKEETVSVSGIYHIQPINKGLVPLYKCLFVYYFLTRPAKKFEFFCGHCGAIKKSAFEELGGFNSKLRWGMDIENDEFGARINSKYVNEANVDIQVKHNFPKFKSLTKLLFNRTYLWVKFFFKNKKFNNSVSTPSNGIGTISATLSLFFLILSVIYHPLLFIALSFLALHLIIFSGLFRFIFKNHDKFITLAMIGIHYYFSIIIGLAGILSLLDFAQSRLTGVEIYGKIKTRD